MNTRRTLAAAAAATALLAAGCGSSDDPKPAGTATAAPATAKTIDISNFKYAPPSLTVATGTRVTWVNKDTAPHTATASGAFDTGSLQKGDSKEITLSKAGTYSYICAFHPFMKGTITVK